MDRAQKDFTVQVGDRSGVDAVDATMADATYHDARNAQLRDINFYRPEGDDHRLVWYEGTGQYIVALEDMAQHTVHQAFRRPEGPERTALLQKALSRLEEASSYTQAMDKASLPLSWGTGLPCATMGRFYLYGWPAPQPLESRLADASAPLVWRMFAGMGYEPLTDTRLLPNTPTTVKPFAWRTVRDPGTEILYGASGRDDGPGLEAL